MGIFSPFLKSVLIDSDNHSQKLEKSAITLVNTDLLKFATKRAERGLVARKLTANRSKPMKLFIVLIIMALVACGKDDSKGSDQVPAHDPTATDSTALEGVPGAQGPKGDKGDTGPKGDKGDQGRPVDKNEWIDPATGDSWFYGPMQDFDAKACDGNGYKLPTTAQLTVANSHGLFIAAGPIGEADAWSNDRLQFLSRVPSDLAGRSKHGLYCIKAN